MNAAPNFSSVFLSLLALACGLVILALGGDMLVAGAKKLARRWGMSSLLVGLTVVAFGTSTPELFVSLVAIGQNHPDIMAGNVVGSNIANIGLVLGLSALLTPLGIKLQAIIKELYIILASTLLVWLITRHGLFSRPFGLLFVGGLVLYTFISYRQARRRKEIIEKIMPSADKDADNPATAGPFFPLAGLTLGGLLLMAVGSNLFIDGAVDIARFWGVSELVIGLTLAALGTSLPELASSVAAIRRRESNLLVGNLIGSNLFNLLMVLGCSAIVKPFSFSSHVLTRDLPVMFAFTAVLIPILAVRQRINRLHGLVLLLAYAVYMYSLA